MARESFAIITAENPFSAGELSPEENQALDAAFRERIAAEGWRSFALWGCDPESDHREQSHAVFIDQATAIKLGRELEQNAVFWVAEGDLVLLDSQGDDRSECLGPFSPRLTLRAPDF